MNGVMCEAYKGIVLISDSYNPLARDSFGDSLQGAILRMP